MSDTQVADGKHGVSHGGPREGAIFAAMLNAMAEVGAIEKDRQNPQQGYKFRGIDDCYNALHPAFVKHGIFLLPTVEEHHVEQYQTGKGAQMLRAVVKQSVTFVARDGSWVRCRTLGEGADSGDKAINKAMAGAMKYALLQTFAIPTAEEKDSEHQSPDPRGAQRPPQQRVTQQYPTQAPSSTARANGPHPGGARGQAPVNRRAPREG